jgi:hypothetical protein
MLSSNFGFSLETSPGIEAFGTHFLQHGPSPMIATQMEATFCRAYNVSKGRRLSLRITVADCVGEPFKLMKVILDGLAQNPEAAFWLTNLEHSPQIVRIFPLDFAYLDSDLNVLQAVELPPGVPLPKFHPRATSALILPLSALASNDTVDGDRLIICSEEAYEQRVSEFASGPAVATPFSTEPEFTPHPNAEVTISDDPAPRAESFERLPFFAPQTTLPVVPPAVGPGSRFTLAVSSTWHVATAVTPPLIVESPGPLESAEAQRDEIAAEESSSESPAPKLNTDDQHEQAPHEAVASVDPEPSPRHRDTVPSTINLTEIAALERAFAKTESQATPRTSSPSPVIPDATSAKPADRTTEDLIARSKEAAEKTYVKVAAPSRPQSAKPKKKSDKAPEKKKDHLGNRVVRWLALDEPLPERRKVIRLLLEGLHAYEATGDPSKRYVVRDICPPGLYIRTDEPWQEGDLLSLVLVKEGATDKDAEHRVSIKARVVRRDEEGVGVAFVFPEGTEFQPWQRARTKRSDETEADFILRELRLARALGFLHRICPWAADEINHALLDRFSNKRVAGAVEITLKAEAILLSRGHLGQPFVPSDLLIRILEGGSWIEDDWIRKMWAGLLVSSGSADGQDRSNLHFIDLLARLTPIHLRIFCFVCHRGVEALATGQSEAALDLYSTAEELMEATDSHSFPRIQQSIGQLSSVGLLTENARPSYAGIDEKSKMRTTPTPLGLKMFARCNGHRA